jgi:hypothetical protein
MAAPANMAIPTLQSLGDLTKEDDQMIMILHAVQFCSTHVAILRTPGWGKYFIYFYILSRCCLLSSMLVTDLMLSLLLLLFFSGTMGLGHGRFVP